MTIKISQLPSASVLNDANILPIVGDVLGTLTNQKITIGLLKAHVLATATISATSVGLGNVTNESKTTMFTNPTFTGTVSGVTAAMVGLGNVTNESKATMFANPTFTGTTTLNTALSGLLKTTAGVVSAATAGTDYQTAQSVTGIVKSSGTTRSAATSGTDYAPGTSALPTGILKSTTTTGALSIAVNGTDYQAPIGTISGLVKGNGVNALTAAIAGTDYQTAQSVTGIVKSSGTTRSAAVAGTDYQAAQSVNGIVKSSGTTRSAAVAGTDYQAPIGTISGIVKGNGANALTAATAGTDYQAPIGTISGLVKGNGANALTAAVANADYQTPVSATGILKSSGVSGNISAATAGTDYQAPVSATGILKSSGVSGNISAAIAGTDYQAPVSATGILKSSGVSGNISAATAGTDYQAPLPTQSGQNGKYLTTDGTTLSWGAVSAVSVDNAVTAAGTTQGTAFVIATDLVNIATGTVNQGVIFPFIVAGRKITVRNSTAVTIKVYPNSGAQINTLGANIGFDLPTLSALEFVCFSSTQWYTLNATFA